MHYSDKMAGIKIEDVVFWAAIIVLIAMMIWKLFGSPSVVDMLIAGVSFLVITVMALWRFSHTLDKRIMKVDNKTTIGFTKVKADTDSIKKDLGHINKKLDNIEKLIKKKK